jgi:hypothetical protein
MFFIRRLCGGLAGCFGLKIHLINPVLLGEECKPIIIRDAGAAPRASPWHHLVSPIRFANGGI